MTAIEGERLCIGGDWGYSLPLFLSLLCPEGNKVTVARSVGCRRMMAVNCGGLMYDKSRGTHEKEEEGGMVEVTLILHASEGGMKGTGKRRWPALTISTGPQHFSVPHPHTIVKRSLKDGIVPRGMSSACQLLLFISVPPTLFCHFVRSLPPSLCPAAAIRQTPFTVRRPPHRRPARARRFAAPTDSCFRSTGGPSALRTGERTRAMELSGNGAAPEEEGARP